MRLAACPLLSLKALKGANQLRTCQPPRDDQGARFHRILMRGANAPRPGLLRNEHTRRACGQMKLLQVIPKAGIARKLKTQLNAKERELRGRGTTLVRQKAGRWVHKSYHGWITWDEAVGGILVAEVQSRAPETEWQLLRAFVGYLERHFADSIESIVITYR